MTDRKKFNITNGTKSTVVIGELASDNSCYIVDYKVHKRVQNFFKAKENDTLKASMVKNNLSMDYEIRKNYSVVRR